MSLAGSRLGPYEVVSLLGAGGMGEVYRARDTKLEREVAIKILPSSLAADADRLARFEREARVLASLNHPHIAQIYGLERQDGQTGREGRSTSFIVMELVDGETLADKLAGLRAKGLGLKGALAIAKQIADALDAAHERGIVHRDLKPANIVITPDGVVKVLDFGLAKPGAGGAGQAGGEGLTNSPTMVGPTVDGVLLGTAPYMSPEQARGKAVDKRTDIWAFGCVLFEMLTGRRAFAGETTSDAIAAILEREPDWSKLPAATSPNVVRVLRRCLEKNLKCRARDIGDVRIELEDTAPAEGQAARTGGGASRNGREYLAWSLAAVLLIALAAITLWRPRAGDAPTPVVARTAIVLPPDQKLASFETAYPLAISRDGARIAYVGEQDGREQLYVRELGELEPKMLSGAAGAMHPFFSPDGQWVGFFAGGALQKVAVAGGAPLRICNVSARSLGATWAPSNTIVFALRGVGLSIVDAAGGEPRTLPGSSPAAWPDILPDGRTVLFATGVGGNISAIATIALDGRKKHIVARTNESPLQGPAVLGTGDIAEPRFVPAGYLVYGQSPGIVRAAPFDLASRSLTGSAVSMVDSVERGRNGGAVYFAASATGLLVYAPTGDRHQLVWVDRSGTATPISPDRLAFRHLRLAPDGRLIAVAINDETRRSDVWIYEGTRGTKRRLTTEHHNLTPVWTPDGARVTFSGAGVVEMSADGSGVRQVILPPDGHARYPSSWSPDGRTLLFEEEDAATTHVRVFPRDGTSKALLAGPFNDREPQFSPDGRWIAYASDESQRYEVYVGSYPDLGNTVAISTDGGIAPRWSHDGREFFFVRATR